MAQLSDNIEQFIKELMCEDTRVELKRNELAQHFGCAPSQINYVLSTRFTLELAEIKVYKDIRNHYNRLTNCEAANISKTVGAAVRQREAITVLKKLNLLDGLSPELQEAAALRAAFPDASLQELCAKCAAPVTRSGLNHRLNKLVLLAQKSANG